MCISTSRRSFFRTPLLIESRPIESNRITDEPPCLLANDWLATLEMSDGKERGEGGGKEQKNSDKAVELFGEGKTAIGRGINTGLPGKSWTGTAAYTLGSIVPNRADKVRRDS